MRSIHQTLDSARKATGGDRLFLAAEAGEQLERTLADPANLAAISKRIMDVATATGSKRLYGASPVGERIAAAAVAGARNGMSDRAAGLSGQRVLVVDGLLVTGVQVAHATRLSVRAGADSVDIAVVAALEDVPPPPASTSMTVLFR